HFSDPFTHQEMRRIGVLCAIVVVSTASYDNPWDRSPDAVQAFNPSHSPDPTCPSNEEYIQCATHCEPTCANPNPVCIRSCAPAQCQCVYGYVRNEYGECMANNGCTVTTEAPVEETTTTEVYTTETPVYTQVTTTEETVTDAPATQYVTAPPSPVSEEPTTTQYESAPTEAPAPVDSAYSPDETPQTIETAEQTATPSTDYAPSAQNSESNDAAPTQDDEDTVVVGGTCGENTCRVGFKCDDSTSVGAKCIPYDTRARSSCSSIRCRPGWSCVIAMDGPRCYTNSVLGITDAPEPTGPEFTGAPVPGYAADEVVPAAESGKSCSDIICPFGLTCFEGHSDPFCRSNTEGRESSAQPCSDVQCAPNEACNDNHNGPVCTKNAPATCAATSCLTGSACVEHPEGARCEAPQGGPQVFPGKTCASTACPDMHQCFDTVDGASCYPIPTDPIEPISEPLKCAQMTCNDGEECTDDENGGVCRPNEVSTSASAPSYPEETASTEENNVADEPQSRAGSSDGDCEHTTCGSGEHCAIDFEGHPYCRAVDGVADDVSPSASSDPSVHIPLCSEITCPSEHECFDDSVKGASCWPIRKESEAVTTPTVTVSAPVPPSCRNLTCHQEELCVEESTGPRCVPAQRRGVTAPGYRRRF
ncbi:hypothetical protein PRIPAC_71031, partial [Pristionchus pacificus]